MNTAIYFDHVASPLGTIVLASDGHALTGLWFDGQRYQPSIGSAWQRRRDLPVLRRTEALLARYFEGEETQFDLPIELRGTPFQRAIWSAIAAVPHGRTIAYRELAARAGRPDCVRAAGAATGRNPISIVIPCHRIIGAGGDLTGYAGGLERKRALLALERGVAAVVPARRAA